MNNINDYSGSSFLTTILRPLLDWVDKVISKIARKLFSSPKEAAPVPSLRGRVQDLPVEERTKIEEKILEEPKPEPVIDVANEQEPLAQDSQDAQDRPSLTYTVAATALSWGLWGLKGVCKGTYNALSWGASWIPGMNSAPVEAEERVIEPVQKSVAEEVAPKGNEPLENNNPVAAMQELASQSKLDFRAITEEQKKDTAYILNTLGDVVGSWRQVGLLRNTGELEEKGAKIKTVHPLVYFNYVISQPELRTQLQKIWADEKGNIGANFRPRTSASLTRVQAKIMPHVKEFAQQIGKPDQAAMLLAHADANEWDEFIKLVLE